MVLLSGFIVRWQSDVVNTKESVLPVCDQPYLTIEYFRTGGGHWTFSEIYALWL